MNLPTAIKNFRKLSSRWKIIFACLLLFMVAVDFAAARWVATMQAYKPEALASPNPDWSTFTDFQMGITLNYPPSWSAPTVLMQPAKTEVDFGNFLTLIKGAIIRPADNRELTYAEAIKLYTQTPLDIVQEHALLHTRGTIIDHKMGPKQIDVTMILPSPDGDLAVIHYQNTPQTVATTKDIEAVLASFQFTGSDKTYLLQHPEWLGDQTVTGFSDPIEKQGIMGDVQPDGLVLVRVEGLNYAATSRVVKLAGFTGQTILMRYREVKRIVFNNQKLLLIDEVKIITPRQLSPTY